MKRYGSLSEMLKVISSRKFLIKYYLNNKIIPLDVYQDLCRIYLDEYPGLKELRKRIF